MNLRETERERERKITKKHSSVRLSATEPRNKFGWRYIHRDQEKHILFGNQHTTIIIFFIITLSSSLLLSDNVHEIS